MASSALLLTMSMGAMSRLVSATRFALCRPSGFDFGLACISAHASGARSAGRAGHDGDGRLRGESRAHPNDPAAATQAVSGHVRVVTGGRTEVAVVQRVGSAARPTTAAVIFVRRRAFYCFELVAASDVVGRL